MLSPLRAACVREGDAPLTSLRDESDAEGEGVRVVV